MDLTAPAVGEAIRRHRERRGLTQQQLANRAGVSVRALRDIEHHRVARPQVGSLRRLADALGVPPGQLAPRPPAACAAVDGALAIGVLGPLTVTRGGATVEIGSGLQRTLLGLLAIQPGQVVGRDEIVDALWGEHPPRTCLELVHGHLAQLRKTLVTPVIASARGGYRLDPQRVTIDSARFGELATQPGRLAEALACWRGPVLAGGELRGHPAAAALVARRIAVALEFADAALAEGQPESVVELLEPLVLAEPLHEGLHARLMLGLAAHGEPGAALRLHAQIARRLGSELGVRPGAALRAAHLSVLQEDADPVPPAAGPAQLPVAVAGFTGRGPELDRLDEVLAEDRGSAGLAVVAGTAGAGKTALAVHWAHQVRDRFPGGQLYADLRGFTAGEPASPIAVLAGFLRALGTAGDQVPDSLPEAAALYRTLLAGRRILVILDNARDAEQVRPLLAGSPGSLVLVTSRDGLTGLVAREGATRVTLGAMAHGEAVALLTRILGEDRTATEPDAVQRLAAACAYLPLALRIAAAKLLGDPSQAIADQAAGLVADALGALEVDGDPESAVRAAFRLSYDMLNAADRRLFRRLGGQPGPDCTVAAVTALAGIGADEVTAGVNRLVAAHLVTPSGSRYGLHDLLRRYAIELAAAEDTPAEREEAARRIARWYAGAVHAAATVLYPHALREPVAGDAGMTFKAGEDALAWLDAEWPSLAALVGAPAPGTPAETSWTIAGALRSYLHARIDAAQWLPFATAALAAARRAGSQRGEAIAHLGLACCSDRQARHEEAIGHYQRAAELARAAGWRDGEGPPLGNLGLVYWKLGRIEDALAQYRAALAVNRETGRLGAQAINLVNIGIVCAELGRPAEAAEHHHEALALHRRSGSRYGEAMALSNLADDYHALGRLAEAERYATSALALDRETGSRSAQAETLRVLAEIHRDTGRAASSRTLASQAAELARAAGDRRLEAGALVTLGRAWLALGEPAESAIQHRRALELATAAANRLHAATATLGLAAAAVADGDAEVALGHARRAHVTARDGRYLLVEAQAEAALAAAHRLAGRSVEAAEHESCAAAVFSSIGRRCAGS